MKRAARFKTGSVVFDKRRKMWNFLWWEDRKRRSKAIGTKQEFPTKASAWEAATGLRAAVQAQHKVSSNPLNMSALIEKYRTEKMPKRSDTRRSYEVWVRNYILPKWGCGVLSDVQARPVELWLETLALAPKSKAHIRGVLSILWDFAMWSGKVATQRNPMELVTVKNVTSRTKHPRSLTVDEFHRFTQHLVEPFRTMALLCCCLGLRISECLALRWSDVDWLDGRLLVARGIVCQQVDDVKTEESLA